MRPIMSHLALIGVAATLAAGTAPRADIYAYVDEHGVRHISNRPNDERYRLVLEEEPAPPAAPARAGTPGKAIYGFVDERGVRHISDTPDDPRYRLIMRVPAYRSGGSGLPFAVNERNRRYLRKAIEVAALRHSIEPELLDAVISAESAYDPGAVSRAGAMGLMQLMPETAARLGVADAFDPRANLDAGARYLRSLLDRFGQLTVALAAYNAGENAVQRHGNQIPPFPETQEYISRVLRFYDHYRTRGSGS